MEYDPNLEAEKEVVGKEETEKRVTVDPEATGEMVVEEAEEKETTPVKSSEAKKQETDSEESAEEKQQTAFEEAAGPAPEGKDAPVAEAETAVDPPAWEQKTVSSKHSTTDFTPETETEKKIVLPDRVQVKVVDNSTGATGQDEFNPSVMKIRVNNGPGESVATEPDVRQQFTGAEIKVGEARTRVSPVVRATQLPVPAIKVRNIVGEVRNVTAEIIKDKVIVQGIVHKQVFFVAVDGIVRHFSEDVPFSTFIDLPGAEPGMNVQVNTRIEKILHHLSADGSTIIQKIILEVFVKVTEFVQVSLELGSGPLLLLPRVIGEGTKQELVETTVTLNTPALKVEEIRGELRAIETDIIPDKVVVQGIIHKQIFFVDLDGRSRHQAEVVPFSLFLDIPGVVPGVDLQVHPRIEGIFFELLSPTELRQKVVIEVFVKATEAVQEQVTIGQGELYKVQQVIGEGQKQILNESELVLDRPALKVREIVGTLRNITAQVIPDKVIVQGIIHKQIFYIGTDNIEYHQGEDLNFSLFIDIPGAAPGLNVHVKPLIETVLFNLEDERTLRQKVIVFVNVVVTESIQIPLVTGDFSLFKLERVVGEGVRQILVERREEVPVPPVRNVVVEVVFPPAGIITGRQQIIVENVVELPVKAIKIKEVQGTITDLRARVIFDDAVLIEGLIIKQVTFVDEENMVRSVTERIPFSILVNVPGITPDSPFTVSVEIENISFKLSPNGRLLRQVIVLNAEVTAETPAPPPFQVVTEVTGPGITTERVLVRAPIQTPTGVEVREFFVVTEVSGPGIERVIKEVVLLDVVNDGNPNPVPIEVVTDVIFAVTPLAALRR